jgi:hypothetical protein
VNVNDEFSVTLRMSGYTDPTEVDGFNFNVNYDTDHFEFVDGFGVGNELSGDPDEQWLHKLNQESPGYALDFSGSSGVVPGRVIIAMFDSALSDPEQGTLAESGFLVSFALRATALGVGEITPAAFLDGSVLFDTLLSSIPNSPSFVGTSVEVIPEPSAAALAAVWLVVGGRRPSRRRARVPEVFAPRVWRMNRAD